MHALILYFVSTIQCQNYSEVNTASTIIIQCQYHVVQKLINYINYIKIQAACMHAIVLKS